MIDQGRGDQLFLPRRGNKYAAAMKLDAELLVTRGRGRWRDENEEEARWTSALKSLMTSWRTWETVRLTTLPVRDMSIAYFPFCNAANELWIFTTIMVF